MEPVPPIHGDEEREMDEEAHEVDDGQHWPGVGEHGGDRQDDAVLEEAGEDDEHVPVGEGGDVVVLVGRLGGGAHHALQCQEHGEDGSREESHPARLGHAQNVLKIGHFTQLNWSNHELLT